MKAMQTYWKNMAARIDALSMRERLMVFIAVAGVLITLLNFLFINPLIKRQKQLSEQIVQSQQSTAAMQSQIQDLLTNSSTDPDLALQVKLAQLRSQAALSGKTLDDIQSKLVSPKQMPALLADILQHNRSVRLIALKTFPVEILNAKTATQSGAKTIPPVADTPMDVDTGNHIYKHGVEISVAGNYLDLTRYLGEIETLPWRMFWGKAIMAVADDHTVTLTLRLYTLSQDKTWLSI